jgi:hypothetical protein
MDIEFPKVMLVILFFFIDDDGRGRISGRHESV